MALNFYLQKSRTTFPPRLANKHTGKQYSDAHVYNKTHKKYICKALADITGSSICSPGPMFPVFPKKGPMSPCSNTYRGLGHITLCGEVVNKLWWLDVLSWAERSRQHRRWQVNLHSNGTCVCRLIDIKHIPVMTASLPPSQPLASVQILESRLPCSGSAF